MRILCSVSSALAVLCLSGLAAASVGYDYASAFTSGSYSSNAGNDSTSQEDDSAAPGSMNAFSAATTLELNEPGYFMRTDANADVSLSGATISGQTSLTREWTLAGGNGFNANTRAEITVDFTLAQASDFTLVTNHATDGPVMAGILFEIRDSGNSVVYGFGGGNTVPTSFMDTGALAAGSYTLVQSLVNSGSFNGSGERNLSMDFAFTVPAPGGLAAAGLGGLALLRRRR